jgi:hypothetical protein
MDFKTIMCVSGLIGWIVIWLDSGVSASDLQIETWVLPGLIILWWVGLK